MTRYESCVGARIILRLKRPNPELGRLFFPAYFRSYDIKFINYIFNKLNYLFIIKIIKPT